MFNRIRVDLAFIDRDAIDDILDKIRDHFENAIVINPGQPNQEPGYIILEECYHDEDPTKPCVVIEEYSL